MDFLTEGRVVFHYVSCKASGKQFICQKDNYFFSVEIS
jgi:hypothetical protein